MHTVRSGENLYRIGKAYGIDYRKLARINRIGTPYRIRSGQKVFVPGATRQLPVRVITPRSVDPRRPDVKSARTVMGKTVFRWPLRGVVTSNFGKRGRGHHDGIDIAAPHGTTIAAAADGKVIFSDRLRGYGNVIIVEHHSGFTTVYAHNERNLLRTGTRVYSGQKIAEVGASGRATGPHLHFEVRRDNIARNPLYYLPHR